MTIADNVAVVRERMSEAAERANRPVDSITLVAVSKRKSVGAIMEAYAAGVRHFGENRAYELQDKAAETDLSDLNWHFIGHLQTRQSAPVAQYATVFHAVDRPKIARCLSLQLLEANRHLELFIEVNISGEETKSGFECAKWETDGGQRETLAAAVEEIAQLPNVSLCGLMTIAPWGARESIIRSVFMRTRRLAAWVCESTSVNWSTGCPLLSIGMTDDYEIGIEEGATHVRVGRAIFGERQ